jgi:valyl-tRNA synthetase
MNDAALRTARLLIRESRTLESLANVKLSIVGPEYVRARNSVTVVIEGLPLTSDLTGLIDEGKERERPARRALKIEKEIAALDKKLANAGFVERAPAEVVQEARARRSELEMAR